LVRGYTGQPPGCNQVPMLVFGKIGPNGKMQGHAWVLRITLTERMRVVMPQKFLAAEMQACVKVDTGNGNSFSPTSTEEFLEHPADFFGQSIRGDRETVD
jgi:hypothetical protein